METLHIAVLNTMYDALMPAQTEAKITAENIAQALSNINDELMNAVEVSKG
jgi:hypothetical protein